MELIASPSMRLSLLDLLLSLDERCARQGVRGKGAPGQAGGLRFGGRRPKGAK
jgi:hypothetical protein